MKKILLIAATVGIAASSNAQLALQNFNAAGLPAGWTMITDSKPVSTTISPAYIIPLLNASAWAKFQRTASDSAMITTSFFATAGTADRWLITPPFMVTSPDMVLKYLIGDLSATGTSPIQIMKGNSTASVAGDFTALSTYTCPAGSGLITSATALGAYNGTTIRLAFRSIGNNNGFPGIDDVETSTMPVTDGAMNGVTFPNLVSSTSSTPVSVTVSNQGYTTITSLQVSYKVDAATPVTQMFSGLSILPYGTSTLTFSTPISSPSVGSHTLVGTVLQTNGAADPVASNNVISGAFAVASKSVGRSGIMEEFTSSTCAPCASFNATFDPLLVSMNANVPSTKFNIIKYQMNWPGAGNDASYNAAGLARRTYYNCNSIPDHFTNGAAGGAGNSSEIAASKTAPAYMDMTSKLTVKGDSMIADVTITPYFTLSGKSYKLHMATTEYHYTNSAATTSQKEYYYVMRNMAGNGAGVSINSFTDGVTQTFRWAHKFTKGTVTQMSNTYWNSPIGSATLVAFLQDEGDKAIMQSESAPAQWPLNIKPLNEVISQANVYPNPATDHTSIAFKLESATNVSLNVTDQLGRVVYTIADQQMNAGTQMFEIPTTSLAAGIYTIKLQGDAGSITERFSVAK